MIGRIMFWGIVGGVVGYYGARWASNVQGAFGDSHFSEAEVDAASFKASAFGASVGALYGWLG